MKHVNDEFWQRFGPEVLAYARAHGKREFFMFGEVFDTHAESFTSHFTTHDQVQAVLDFPFQDGGAGLRGQLARRPTSCATSSPATTGTRTPTRTSTSCRRSSGNHDMGRIGRFVGQGNPGAGDAELLARDRLAHELMYLSRGNPVVYYGDEQGFTGDGGDQDARQDMFPSQVASYNDDDLIGTDATTAQDNFDPSHPLYRAIARPGARSRSATRRCATARRSDRLSSRRRASTRSRASTAAQQREYVVALNNSRVGRRPRASRRTCRAALVRAAVRRRPTRWVEERLGQAAERDGAAAVGGRLRGDAADPAQPAGAVDRPGRAPASAARPRTRSARPSAATSFYEVTFLAQGRSRRAGRRSAPTTTRPTGSSTTSPTSRPGHAWSTRRSSLDNARPHAHEHHAQRDGRPAGDRARGPGRRRAGARRASRSARSRRPSTPTTS